MNNLTSTLSDKQYWAVEQEHITSESIEFLLKIRAFRGSQMDKLMRELDKTQALIEQRREHGASQEELDELCERFQQSEDLWLWNLRQHNDINEELDNLGYDVRGTSNK